jgi:hypothetical protein
MNDVWLESPQRLEELQRQSSHTHPPFLAVVNGNSGCGELVCVDPETAEAEDAGFVSAPDHGEREVADDTLQPSAA